MSDTEQKVLDLLEALRWVAANAEDTSSRGWSAEYALSVLRDIRQAAHDAIAKAEGRQP